MPDELERLPFPDETAGLKVWRCSVPLGWVPIVNGLHGEIAALVPEYTVTQVKEKFGGLRFQASFPEGTPEDVRARAIALIRRAEDRSKFVCDICGAPGRLSRDLGWWRTRCADHLESEPKEAEPQ